MTFEELGTALAQEREKRGLSIEDVANQLKINPRLLRAIEAGDGAGLPHHSYVRGFIRTYGHFLGISNEEIQSALASLQPEDLAKPRPKIASQTPEVELPAPKRGADGGSGIKIIAALLIIGVLVAGGWWAWDHGLLKFLDKKPDAPVTLEQKLPGADQYLAAKDAERQTASKEPEKPPLDGPAAQKLPEAALDPQLPAPLPAPQPAVGSVESSPEPTVEKTPEIVDRVDASATSGQHKLIITAIEECWVHSNADKTDTRQFSLRKGDTFALTFAKSLELKLGNAGGVRLRYDGNDLPPPGTSGQVRTVTFPPASD